MMPAYILTSELKPQLTAHPRLDMIYALVNQLNVYDDEDLATVSMINGIILGEDIVGD